jgi:hypothetical protein
MRKTIALLATCCLLLSGCAGSQTDGGENTAPAVEPIPVATEELAAAATGQPDDTRTVNPLPDMTMENLTDAILSVSLGEGDAYVDDSGRMQMDLKIYAYDQYDMVDIAGLKVGDILVRHSGEVEVISIEENEAGRISINGGLENDGFDLATDDSGIFYEVGFNDSKNWYQVGEATIRVSADFEGIDHADLDLGEVIIYPGDFLIGAVTNYDFTPDNTTVRVEDGQIVEMNRRFVP